MCEICSKLTIKTPERHRWRHSGVCIVNSKEISHIVLMFLLLTLNKNILWKKFTVQILMMSLENVILNKSGTQQNPAHSYLFEVNNKNSRKRCEICSKLTIKTPELRHWRHSVVFIVNISIFRNFFLCFYCWLWASKCELRIAITECIWRRFKSRMNSYKQLPTYHFQLVFHWINIILNT